MFEDERGGERDDAAVDAVLTAALADALAAVPAERLLALVVDRLLAQAPVELPGPLALARLTTLGTSLERLSAARLAGVLDLDNRQLYALDGAGSTRGWLRAQPGGDIGQLTLARRLALRPHVAHAHRAGTLATRTAGQLCTALDTIPAGLDDDVVRATIEHGIGELLRAHRGGTAPDTSDEARLVAQHAADQAVLDACCADTLTSPAERLEPALVLLAQRLPAGLLGWALRTLTDPLQPDATDSTDSDPAADPYYLELRPLLDGDVDLRGHLDPETGHALAAEIDRRLQSARAAAAEAAAAEAAAAEAAAAEAAAAETAAAEAEAAGRAAADAAVTTAEQAVARVPTVAPSAGDTDTAARRGARGRARLVPIGRLRVDALRSLLHDLTAIAPGSGQPRPAQLTISATLEAVEGRLGVLPGLLTTSRQPARLRTETLQRLGCYSDLTVVLLDALGNPVGASGSHRSATRRERAALRAQWGPTCAVNGCANTQTVPHHVVPWWLSRRTRLRDLVPLCEHCHHDLHEGHRTLRLRNSRLIDDCGWAETSGRTGQSDDGRRPAAAA